MLVDELKKRDWIVVIAGVRNGGAFGREDDDIHALFEYLGARPDVDPERIGCFGGSYGGFLTLRLARRAGDKLACAGMGAPAPVDREMFVFGDLSQPPLSELSEDSRERIAGLQSRLARPANYGLPEDTPNEFVVDLIRQNSPLNYAEELQCPLLFVQGKQDTKVPYFLTMELVEKLRELGKPVETHIAAKGPHGFYWGVPVGQSKMEDLPEHEAAKRAILDFFDRHLGGSGKPDSEAGAPFSARAAGAEKRFSSGLARETSGATIPQDETPWEELPDGSLGKAVTYPSADGLELGAYIRKPPGAGPFPAVLMLPGGGGNEKGAQQLARREHPAGDFLSAGWVVNAISYRRPNQPTPNMDKREWDDTANALQTLRAYSFVDADRVALVGHSHGGRVVTMMASRVDARCGAPMAAATLNLVEMRTRQQRGESFSPVAMRMMDNMEQIHGAKILEKPELFLRFSPFSEVKKVRFPLLLMYAENDNSGPVAIVQAYEKELKKAGKEVESYYPKQGGHGVFLGKPQVVPETLETARRAVAFIRKHFERDGNEDPGA